MIYLFCMKEWKSKKVEKLEANLHGKVEYVIHIKNETLNHGLVLKKLIEWLNLIKVLGLNHILIGILIYEKKQKTTLRQTFLSWWIMQILEKLWKMWENIERY